MSLLGPRMQALDTSASGCDNIVSVSWVRRGSISRQTTAAVLLRARAILLRNYRVFDRIGFVPGVQNTMANAASRLWTLSDADLFAYFNLHFPQETSW